MRTTFAVVVAVIIGALAPPAGAAGPTVCRFTVDVTASPGLSTTPSSGTSASEGDTGTIECDGWVDGRQPTGPGTFGVAGRYGTAGPDACGSGGEGAGVQSFAIPTRQGTVEVENRFTFMYDGSDGDAVSGRFHSERFSGTFEMISLEGACSGTSVTRMVLRGEGTLRSAWSSRRGEACGGSAASV